MYIKKDVKFTIYIICLIAVDRYFSLREYLHRNPAQVLFVTVHHAGAVIKSVTAVRHRKTALTGTWKLVKLTIWEKNRSSCSNQNLDGSMDTEDNGGISMNLHYFKTIQFDGSASFWKRITHEIYENIDTLDINDPWYLVHS